VGSKLAGGGLEGSLLAACLVPGRPRSQSAQATRQAIPEQSGFGILAELLGIFKRTNTGIEVADGHLRIGVDLLAVPVRESSML
jgi:hypothetical protein